ncbi:MAG: hypothetical protein HYW34_00010 [Candidatus Brennerbacteria bacterium]|nr:hypothetical protein [Candidatus Brennerbacteria bacterium]
MEIISSLGFVILMIVVFTNFLLAIFVYKNNPTSATNKLFALLNISVSLWLFAMYISFQQDSPNSLFWIKLTLFLATPMNLLFFLVSHTLPNYKLRLNNKILFIFISLVFLIMMIAISPYSFTGLEVVNNRPNPIAGIGLIPFGIFSIFMNAAAVYILFKRIRLSFGVERQQLRFIMFGILLMFFLIITTIFLPVALLHSNMFVPFFPLYPLIFIILTAYSIVKHHLFNLKVIATEVLTIGIWLALLSKVALATSAVAMAVDIFIFLATVIFGIFLIKSVLKEVQQREKLQELTIKLEAANTQLVDLSRFKTELLSLASHQVKSPLAVIKGYASILLDGLYGKMNGKIKETVFKMKESTEGLIVLVNNLLDFRKIEEGKMEYQFQPLKLKELIVGVISELKPLADSQNLELTFESRSDKSVNADPVKLKQVVQNLVDNAIKYTPNGFVKVELKEDGESLVFSVKDSGLGMSAGLLPQVFEEFVRDERVKKEIRGTGLGLYIAKKIIQAHNGEIWTESEGEGKGSVFSFKLKIID